ncbi:putative colanic acid biosynthesis acetyltransferase WcaF [Pseudarthrobacter siccitolerans]|uniref:Colanic acid biosynthesis acetyltransferase WcaF n=1 Tax=Pseudarthrobacter siccitolerans TaxID=861266 RepID=A0ABU0PKF0_9MICC|nr:putative colanic acid biosynthesis acetyltransferase WcaF [Pseudarthrobacter siccitolerans]
MIEQGQEDAAGIRVIDLSKAPGEQTAWDRPKAVIYLWAIAELLFVTNSWQVSSRLRTAVLRAFGARIGRGVIMRPRIRVKFPWKLRVGDNSWIGEGVWIHNQDLVSIGANVVVSQETFITTGSHAVRDDMRLLTRPVIVEDGAWLTTRCIVLGGVVVGRSAVVEPLTKLGKSVPAGEIWGGDPAVRRGKRFVD